MLTCDVFRRVGNHPGRSHNVYLLSRKTLVPLLLLPLQGDFMSTAFYLTGVLFTGMIYGVEFRLRNPGNSGWLYRPVMTLMSTFILTWLLPYAAITIRKSSWR